MTLQEQLQFLEELARQYVKLASKHINDPDTSNMYRDYAMSVDEVKASLRYLQDIQVIVENLSGGE